MQGWRKLVQTSVFCEHFPKGLDRFKMTPCKKKKKKLQVRTILLNLIQNIFTSLLNASLTRGGCSYRRPSTLYVDKCNWSLSQALPILQYYFDCLHLIRAKGQTIDFPTTSVINCESNMVHQRNYICHFLCRWKNAVVDWNGSEPILWCSLALNSIKPGVLLWVDLLTGIWKMPVKDIPKNIFSAKCMKSPQR